MQSTRDRISTSIDTVEPKLNTELASQLSSLLRVVAALPHCNFLVQVDKLYPESFIAMTAGDGRRLGSSSSYMSAVLPSNFTFFGYDGTNSDLARQLYLRAQTGDTAKPLTSFQVPNKVQQRLDDLNIRWDGLSGIAQLALLWDTGFGITLDNKPVQIWTLGGHSMTDLAIPLVQFQAVGCVEMNCTQPDNTTSYSNLYCNGEQMLNAVRCVMDEFVETVKIHGAMWITGGNPKSIPIPRVRKHEWEEDSTKISYSIFAVHTVDKNEEPAYGVCPTSDENEGYGSLVLSCYPIGKVSDDVRSAMEEVQGTPWVSRWVVEDYSGVRPGESASNSFSNSHGGFNMLLLAPIIGGVVVVVGIIGLVLFFKRRRVKNASNDNTPEENLGSPHSLYHRATTSPSDDKIPLERPTNETTDMETASSRNTSNRLRRMSNETTLSSESNVTLKTLLGSEYLVGKRIAYELIHFDRALSKGANGEVWIGEYQGQQVALKRLFQNKNNRAEDVEEFAREIELNASLTHPNVVAFIGVAWNTLNNLVMVLEFFPGGDLQDYLAKNADLLTWAKDKIDIAIGLGRALEYLHVRSPPLIHRDIKSRNVLLTRKLEPKLIDFGVSRGRQEYSMTAGVGTPYWTAPEILEGKRYTEQADIYSFGVVLSELDTCKLPYHDAVAPDGKKPKPFQILTDVMAGTLRPSYSDTCPRRIRRLGVACCQNDPTRRPTAAQVVAMLEGDD
ncbi:unnamed protein product [Phytophthora fragariaefolia]|uniref:Unnamed protein product n=1 Tax=Phytophthora fragariaefolia TaxID=1490495 RepID=A0A9W6WWW8_9STRA|nr:unnamed protein product [Phytophthora fragariaefolia]